MSRHRRALMSALVCLLVAGLLAACGWSASEGVRPDTPDTGRSGVVECGLHVIGDGPRIERLQELVWASSIIAVGTITAESEPFVADYYGQPAYARDYQITVETLVRGAASDTTTLTVRRHGVTVDGCEQHLGEPVYTPGERVLLFLWESGMPSDNAPRLVPVMQSEGVWRVAANDRVRVRIPFQVPGGNTLSTVLRSIATTLRGQPPIGSMAIGTAVPLTVAPLWLDASDGIPDEPPVDLGHACSGQFAEAHPQFHSATQLAWFSTMAFIGTVTAQGAAYVVNDGAQPVIATDVAVHVAELIRGPSMMQDGVVTVRQLGGTVGDCTQTYEGDPVLAVGDHVLLFLVPDERGPVGSAQLYPLAQSQGIWPIIAGNLVSNPFMAGMSGTPRRRLARCPSISSCWSVRCRSASRINSGQDSAIASNNAHGTRRRPIRVCWRCWERVATG